MDAMGADIAFLSHPPIFSGPISEENRKMARELNQFIKNGACKQYPERFGFFATTPFLEDIQGVHDQSPPFESYASLNTV